MRQLHAGDYDADSLAQLLHEASVPVMLRHPISPSAFSWRLQSMASLLALHGDDSIEGGVYRGFTEQDRVDVSLPLRGFFPALRNGSVPAESYLFLDVSEMALAGSSRPLGDLYGRVSLLRDRGYAYAPAAARGRPVLSAGGWGSGRPFHSHGPALNALVAGAKHWFVQRPDATPGGGAVDVPRRTGEALAAGWEDGLWQCTQRAGDLLWVPNLLEHATHNYDDEVVALFHVINDLGETPLHAAARAGDVAAVRSLLRDSGGSHLHARSKRGVTPLIFASGAGHVAAMQPLIAAGANLSAAASNGGQALHAAVVGGHARAVELLLRHGAPAEARDGQGETPRDLATRLGHVEIARALLGGAGVARSVEEDALLLSQPFIEEGVLLTSAASGRRVYLHRLAELFTARCGNGWWTRPRRRCSRSEVFLTRRGNSLQRVDSSTLSLAGTASLAVPLSTASPAVRSVEAARCLSDQRPVLGCIPFPSAALAFTRCLEGTARRHARALSSHNRTAPGASSHDSQNRTAGTGSQGRARGLTGGGAKP